MRTMWQVSLSDPYPEWTSFSILQSFAILKHISSSKKEAFLIKNILKNWQYTAHLAPSNKQTQKGS